MKGASVVTMLIGLILFMRAGDGYRPLENYSMSALLFMLSTSYAAGIL